MQNLYQDGMNCKIEVKVYIYNPNFVRPVPFPSKHIAGTITSTRSINLGSNKITIPIKSQFSYYDEQLKIEHTLTEIFAIRSIVQLKIKRNNSNFRQLNMGIVTDVSRQINPSGLLVYNVTIEGMDSVFKDNDIFFDLQSANENNQVRQSENIEGSMEGMKNMLKESKSISSTLNILWDELFCHFLLGTLIGGAPKYGGQNLLTETKNTSSSLLKFTSTSEAYTENFIHIVQFMSNMNIGSKINLIEILRSYASPPLYELFVDSLEDDSANLNQGILSIGRPGKFRVRNYSVIKDSSNLVFRQTPFVYFKDGIWDNTINPFYEIFISQIMDISCNNPDTNHKSGVHVGLSFHESASLILNYPKYNSILLKLFGKRLLEVNLAGMKTTTDPKKTEVEKSKMEMDDIRNMLFDIFCNPNDLKTMTGSITLPFDFIRVGVPFYINYNDTESPSPSIFENIRDLVGNFGYIETVTDSFDSSGKASTTISFKWGVDPNHKYYI